MCFKVIKHKKIKQGTYTSPDPSCKVDCCCFSKHEKCRIYKIHRANTHQQFSSFLRILTGWKVTYSTSSSIKKEIKGCQCNYTLKTQMMTKPVLSFLSLTFFSVECLVRWGWLSVFGHGFFQFLFIEFPCGICKTPTCDILPNHIWRLLPMIKWNWCWITYLLWVHVWCHIHQAADRYLYQTYHLERPWLK